MIGQSIGGYKVVSKLGEGGMGVVYLAEHRRIARRAAIKVLRPDLTDNPEIVARFFTEARATSMIRHPGIVDVIDCDVLADGNAYIVMEYLEGETLTAAIAREGRLPLARAMSLVRNVGDALAAAHERGIVHRDLKPDNLFLPTAAGGAPAAPIKILDFGIAKLTMLEAGGHHKTRTGRLLGTPTYMSPEQCRGAKDIDHRTDIYSLGCILFEMLCGRPPFDEQGFGQLVYSHLSVVPPPARSFEPSLPVAVDKLLARMLAKAAEQRPQSLREVVADIDRITATPAAPVRPVTEAYRAGGSGRAVVAPPSEPTPLPVAAAARLPGERKPSPARGRTTLGAAASESMPVVEGYGAHHLAAGRRSWSGPLIAVATAALVVGGVVSWRQLSARTGAEPAAASVAPAAPAATAVATPEPAKPVSAAPVAAPEPMPPAPTAAPEPAEIAPSAPGAAPAAPAAEPRHAKAATSAGGGSKTVTVSIASEPPGAEVCLAGIRRLMGKTRFDWTTERNTRPVRLLVRKEGYRGEEISVVPDSNAKRHVLLKKLGLDDLEDTETCE